MNNPKSIRTFLKQFYQLILLVISMSGYVVKHATWSKTITILLSLGLSTYLGNLQADNFNLAIIYFIVAEVFYMGFITLILSQNGIRQWFIKKWADEEKAYRAYEGILGVLFFHNGVSIGYMASSRQGFLFQFVQKEYLLAVIVILFVIGFLIKIMSAKVVGIDIYYWKDMFLGRKICEFVVSGPYKYLRNPMYGIGQVQVYAIALWYGSVSGIIAGAVNQMLIFTFYYLVEKAFIKRVYLSNTLQPSMVVSQ